MFVRVASYRVQVGDLAMFPRQAQNVQGAEAYRDSSYRPLEPFGFRPATLGRVLVSIARSLQELKPSFHVAFKSSPLIVGCCLKPDRILCRGGVDRQVVSQAMNQSGGLPVLAICSLHRQPGLALLKPLGGAVGSIKTNHS